MFTKILLSLAILFNLRFADVRKTWVSSWSPVTIQSYDPVTKEGIEFIVPDDLEIETISGKGFWLVGKLKQAKDKEWAIGSLEDALGVPMERNSSFRWGVKWEKKSLDKYLVSQTTVDGVSIKKLDDSWSKVSKDWFVSSKLAEENVVLRIENTVSYSGLGGHAAKILEGCGIKVGLITSSDANIGKCEMVGKGLTAEYVSHKFGCELKEGNELLLRLGKEYLDYWKGK